jgi:ribose 1,5-bisphosphokinase PhnN
MLADLLWRQTTVSQEWLAEKLAMRSAANVSQQLRRLDRKQATAKLPDALQNFLADAMSPKPER